MEFFDLFNENPINPIDNFGYLKDIAGFEDIYNPAMRILGLYKINIIHCGQELRSLWEAVVSKTCELLGIDLNSFDGRYAPTKLLKKVDVIYKSAVKPDLLRSNMINDAKYTKKREKFVSSMLGLYVNNGKILINDKAEEIYRYNYYIINEDGNDSAIEGRTNRPEIKPEYGTNIIKFLKDHYSDYKLGYMLKGNTNFTLFNTFHHENEKTDTKWKVNIEGYDNNNINIFYNDATYHSLEFLNYYLVNLVNACGLLNEELKGSRYPKLNKDYFPIGDRRVVNYYEHYEKQSTNQENDKKTTSPVNEDQPKAPVNDYNLISTVKYLPNTNDVVYSVIKQFNYANGLNEGYTELYNNLQQISPVINTIRKVSVADGRALTKEISEITEYKLFEYELVPNAMLHTLSSEYLKSLNGSKKRELINSLIEKLRALHSRNVYLRYINHESFVVIEQQGEELELYPINFDVANRIDRINGFTIKNHVKSANDFFYSASIEKLIKIVDLSKDYIAKSFDTLYMLFLVAYIKCNANPARNPSAVFKKNREIVKFMDDLVKQLGSGSEFDAEYYFNEGVRLICNMIADLQNFI